MQLDTDYVRAQFPAFQEPGLRNLAFFENAGGSFPCRYVTWRLNRFYRERKVQPYGAYPISELAGGEMDEARRRLSLILGVNFDEVAFGPSTTQNSYVLAQAFGRMLTVGDAIVVTNQDHEANSGPWRRLTEFGIDVREWQIDPETGHLNVDDLFPLMADDRVRLVCFPHCSNVVGEINDAARLVYHIHRAGAFACVDGVSYAPHGLPNVGRMNADIYLFSTYKTYGPHQGVMVVRRMLAAQLPNQGHHFNGGTLYNRFTPAGPDHAQVAACAGIADYIDKLYHHHMKAGRDAGARGVWVHDLMRQHEVSLLEPLMHYLGGRNDIRILGPRTTQNRAPTVALALDRPGLEVARDLSPLGILAGGGDFYAGRPLQAMGIDPDHGVLRLSFVHYTTADEVDRLITALDQVL
ncbi:aminotransferase class V-fold PLP-dependent enzyme [Actibacterium sp. 188UL27-1]|uniref:aminotransferase class V-fold PLP-dependent enzyme n=1 Tax=Actibacterium sp. 188UL27-1 TaxID=2786961 RepID=UPI001957E132|nr:aminotransferase class V-fold PLP-dependent enzyme [Actibacterium sp. 188UL27-1]MBM7067878.1 aminotransferase class V-fold PLP-dependent enzyme [Actibacterium sp. 188UL27-1]